MRAKHYAKDLCQLKLVSREQMEKYKVLFYSYKDLVGSHSVSLNFSTIWDKFLALGAALFTNPCIHFFFTVQKKNRSYLKQVKGSER